MNHGNYRSKKPLTVEDINGIIKLLKVDPVLGYKQLTSLDYPLPPIYRNPKFWNTYDGAEINDPIINERFNSLRFFYNSSDNFYKKYKEELEKFKRIETEERIKFLFPIYRKELTNSPNPDLSKIDRIFFLSEAINSALSLPFEKNNEPEDLDPNFPYYLYNSKVFQEMSDAYAFWGFEIYAGKDEEYFLRPKNEINWGIRIEEILKNQLLFSAYGNKHSIDVSNLQPFKDMDQTYETQKGLCTSLVENGTIISSQEGTFGRTVDNIFDIKHLDFIHKQWFLKLYRDELESCFEPKYATLLEKTSLKFEKGMVNLFDLFSLLAGIKSLLSITIPYNLSKEKSTVIFDIKELIERLDSLCFPKTFTVEYVKHLLKFAISKQKFPGIFINDSKILISFAVFSYFPILNTIFQRCFSDIFYNQIAEINNDNLKKENEHSIREKSVIKGLKALFKDNSFEVLTNIELKKENSGNDGEIDLIVADNTEKTIVVLEVKLDNTANDRWINKVRWLKEHITKAKEQHNKDDVFINCEAGKDYLSKNGIYYDDSWRKYHFLVSDNMLCDHEGYWFNKKSKKYFKKISIFELECLMGNLDICKEGTRKWVLYHTNLIMKYRPEVNIPQELKNFIDDDNDFSNTMKFKDFILRNRVFTNKQNSLTQLVKLINDGILWDVPEKWFDGINYKLTTEYCEPKYSLIV